MKTFSTIWVLVALIACFTLSPNTMGAAFCELLNLVLAVLCARKYNPSLFR